ncbi:hypothetical protein OJAV_G00050790 [Oryzias javanicus]|uniref:Uncharacterized protein n=1 Tax=Oryzias javanicus TaxID=123683 RepID=A0A437D9C6_ORYJA|nr:hypothetical protein OJAV_G00050790 [Oryzias javanicus]
MDAATSTSLKMSDTQSLDFVGSSIRPASRFPRKQCSEPEHLTLTLSIIHFQFTYEERFKERRSSLQGEEELSKPEASGGISDACSRRRVKQVAGEVPALFIPYAGWDLFSSISRVFIDTRTSDETGNQGVRTDPSEEIVTASATTETLSQ